MLRNETSRNNRNTDNAIKIPQKQVNVSDTINGEVKKLQPPAIQLDPISYYREK